MRGPGHVVTPSGAIMSDDPAAGGNFFSQYGLHANAQELITAHKATQDIALQRASLTGVDEEATAEANDDLKATAKKFDLADGETLLAAAVRGNALVGVIEDATGNVFKTVVGANSDYEPPKLTVEQAEARGAVERDAAVRREVAQLRAEMEQQLAEARDDMQAEMADAIAKVRADAQKEADKTVKKAEKDADKSDTGSSSGSSRASGARKRKSAAKRKSKSKSKRSSSGSSGGTQSAFDTSTAASTAAAKSKDDAGSASK